MNKTTWHEQMRILILTLPPPPPPPPPLNYYKEKWKDKPSGFDY